MTPPIIVIGGGIGGLCAALRLARAGAGVQLLEARSMLGGLASGLEAEGLAFDAGPYVLLDRPGLEWAFGRLGLDADSELRLRRIDDFYDVGREGEAPVSVGASLEATAERFGARWPGSAAAYTTFVGGMEARRRRLEPLLRRSHPTALDLLRSGAWRDAPFLLRSLRAVLDEARLPPPIRDAVSIWTHVAGQRAGEAPSPMAFVPALIHGPGPFLPRGGMRAVALALERAARGAGVEIRTSARVQRIRTRDRRVEGVELDGGAVVPARAVISGAGGLATCLALCDAVPRRFAVDLEALPLQSPGTCLYLEVRTVKRGAYLRFRLAGPGGTRLLILPPAQDDGRTAARLVAPMDHGAAESLGPEGQADFAQRLAEEPWWREHVGEARIVATRRPTDWGREHGLWRDAMNPVMTARLMRRGRLPHRVPGVRGLFLCGSATHPGQWVSFCAISGILAADLALAERA